MALGRPGRIPWHMAQELGTGDCSEQHPVGGSFPAPVGCLPAELGAGLGGNRARLGGNSPTEGSGEALGTPWLHGTDCCPPAIAQVSRLPEQAAGTQPCSRASDVTKRHPGQQQRSLVHGRSPHACTACPLAPSPMHASVSPCHTPAVPACMALSLCMHMCHHPRAGASCLQVLTCCPYTNRPPSPRCPRAHVCACCGFRRWVPAVSATSFSKQLLAASCLHHLCSCGTAGTLQLSEHCFVPRGAVRMGKVEL